MARPGLSKKVARISENPEKYLNLQMKILLIRNGMYIFII
jgi:hypothetical protein